jgi:phenylpyruvate tautomerase PptA (4-oxalocrotonate tautomerase family)
MPLLKLQTTLEIPADKRRPLMSSLSKAVASTIGKPEQYVMVAVDEAAIIMSGNEGEAAFVDIRSIGGLGGDVNRKLSQQVCKLLGDSLGIPSERVFLNFTDVPASHWGWKGGTFG